MTDSNHDIVPTLRMFNGLVMNKAADEIEALRDLLRSARAIAQRKGEGTAWERFDASIFRMGIGSITARTYRILPSDEDSHD